VGNRQFTCGVATFAGEVPGNTSDVKMVPTYESCDTKPVLGVSLSATFTTNECYYTFTGEKTVEAGKYGVSMHLECPAEKELVIHVKSGSTDVCTVTIKPQTITGLTATNSVGTPDDIQLDANGAKVQTTIHGTLCGADGKETNKEFEGVYEGTTTIRAYHGEGQVDLTVSD
jgi:hypothetical protein